MDVGLCYMYKPLLQNDGMYTTNMEIDRKIQYYLILNGIKEQINLYFS